MRIGINGSFWNLPMTGSGLYLRELLPALVRTAPNDEFVVIAPHGESIPTLAETLPRVSFVQPNVPVAGIGENPAKLWFEQVTFPTAARRMQVDLAHVPYFASPYFPSVATVVTVHDLIPMLLPLYRGSLLVRLYTRLVGAAARRARAIIADSECTKRDIVQHLHIAPERVHVVYLGVNERFKPVPNKSVCDKYGMPARALFYLGGYDQRKNIRVLLEALTPLGAYYRNGYRLVLAGDLPKQDSAFFPDPRRIAREIGLPDDAVCYLGKVEEMDKPALVASASVFLYPSLYEGFGLQALEAMACGTPVICSNVSSLPEIVGDAGHCVDPRDAQLWAEAIAQVLDDQDRQERMRAEGLDRARQFTWERTAQETLAVYRGL